MERVVKASLDRFEGDIAVIYSDDEGSKYDVSRRLVEGLHTGDRVLLKVSQGEVIGVERDEKATNGAKERIKRKYRAVQKGRHPDD